MTYMSKVMDCLQIYWTFTMYEGWPSVGIGAELICANALTCLPALYSDVGCTPHYAIIKSFGSLFKKKRNIDTHSQYVSTVWHNPRAQPCNWGPWKLFLTCGGVVIIFCTLKKNFYHRGKFYPLPPPGRNYWQLPQKKNSYHLPVCTAGEWYFFIFVQH